VPEFATPPPYRPNRATVWREAFYNMRVDGLPVRPDSATLTAQTAAFHQTLAEPHTYVRFGPDGIDKWNRQPQSPEMGYFVDRLPEGTSVAFNSPARRNWTINNSNPHHPGRHLYFSGLRQQNATNLFGTYTIASVIGGGDKHAIMWSPESRELVEMIQYRGDRAEAAHGATYITDDYEMPLGTNGTTPAGAIATRMPVAPLFFTWQDLVDCGTTGDLGHMVGIVLKDGDSDYIWPARKSDFIRSDGIAQGMVLRLRDDFDETQFPLEPLRALARTLKRYGAVVFDISNYMQIVAPNDPQWPRTVGNGNDWSTNVDITDFEVVDTSSVATPPFTRFYPLEPSPTTIRVGVSGSFASLASKFETPTGQPVPMHRVHIPNWANRNQIAVEIEAASRAGRTLHVSIGTPTWSAVAAGNHDTEINTLFDQIRATETCVWVSFAPNPEATAGPAGFTAANWRAMQLRFDARRVARNATQALVVPVVSSSTFTSGTPADWVIEDIAKFPLYGVTFASNTFATSPTDLRNNTEWAAFTGYLSSRNIDICVPSVGGTGTGQRDARFWQAVVTEALDPSNRVRAVCWDDSGNNTLGGATDLSGAVLDAVRNSFTAPTAYRGGGWRGNPTGVIDSIRTLDTVPGVSPPAPGTHNVYRRIAGNWVLQRVRRRTGLTWSTQIVRRVGTGPVSTDLYTDTYQESY